MGRLLPDPGTESRSDASGRAGGANQIAVALSHGWLVSPDCDPLVPAHVQARLAAISPRLAMTFHKGIGGFTLMLKWADGDPRYAEIVEGRMPDYPWEILPGGFIPAHLGPDDALAWVESHLQRVSSSREDVRRMVRDEHEATERQRLGMEQKLRETGAQHFDEAMSAATGARADRFGKNRKTVTLTESNGTQE